MTRPLPNATDVDQRVGERIRQRRVLLGLTQDQLAEGLGISYQQVQKYETGANRVSAGRLYQVAVSLDTPVSYFFEGTVDAEIGDHWAPDSSRNVIDLVRNFAKIEDDKVRVTIMTLVRTLSNSDRPDLDETPTVALNAPSARPHMNGSNGSVANGSSANGLSAAAGNGGGSGRD